MHARAAELIARLALEPHREGGWFARAFRSGSSVTPGDSRPARAALTVIHYLLVAGTHSRWHRVRSDESWHHHEGAAIELLMAPPEGGVVRAVRIGAASATEQPSAVVPAGWWQAARPLGDYALASCAVAPGFEWEDFTLLADLPEQQRSTLEPPGLARLLS
jgi:predicted cupin superfamily sugar epimerase